MVVEKQVAGPLQHGEDQEQHSWMIQSTGDAYAELFRRDYGPHGLRKLTAAATLADSVDAAARELLPMATNAAAPRLSSRWGVWTGHCAGLHAGHPMQSRLAAG